MAHQSLESDLDFDKACDDLSDLGLPFPTTPASQRVIGSGGDVCKTLHGVSLQQLFDAVQSVKGSNDAFDTETTTPTGSVHKTHASHEVGSSSKTATTLKEAPSSHHGDDSRTDFETGATKPQAVSTKAPSTVQVAEPNLSSPALIPTRDVPVRSVRRKIGSRAKKSSRVTSYFEEVESKNPSRGGKFDSICLQCDYAVSSTETRYKLFHVILCSNIPFSVRLGIYFTSNDKNKPPLIEAPPHHCEPHQARVIVRKQTESLKDLIEGHLSRRDDLSRDQALARWMMAQVDIKTNRRIDECDEEESKVLSGLLMDFVVEENIPFAVCGSRDYAPRPLGRLLNYARPGYKMPSVGKVAGEMLTTYYNIVKREIQRRLKNMIPDQCRVTIMFDGSEDVKNQPVINVLMRVMGGSRGSVKTFFLKSVYTGYDTCDASYYVSMVEEVVREFGGFESIAGVVTDNTSSVLNARDILQQKYSRLVSSQDQAHVADLLMSDIGEIGWIRETLKSVTSIGTYLRRFRKLRAKVVEMMEQYNVEVRKVLNASRQTNLQRKKQKTGETCTEEDSMVVEVGHHVEGELESGGINPDAPRNPREDSDDEQSDEEDEQSDEDDDKMSAGDVYSSEDESGQRKAPHIVTVNNILSSQIHSAVRELGVSHEEDTDIVSAKADQLSLNPQAAMNSCAGDAPRFACIMKKVSAVRFASLEKLLKEYKSLRKVLLNLVSSGDFESFCSLKSSKDRLQLQQNFTSLIKDECLFHRVVQVHAIMKACRLYLRMFDSESCLISEVVRATTMLEQTLRNLPSQCFPEPCEQHHRELLEVFRNRKEGPIPGRKRIKINLVSDLHVAAALLDPYRCPFDISGQKVRLRDHLEKYLSGSGVLEFRDELYKDEFIVEMMNQYDIAHSLWKEKGYVRADSERTSAAERREAQGLSSLRTLRERSPISWWTAGSLRLPKDGFAKKAAKALVEFAVRTLSVSPTATATERTFSHLSRIQPKQRSGLSQEKVEKLLFCQWNLRVLRKVANAYELDVQSEAKKQNSAINQLRAHRKHVTTMSFLGTLRSERMGIEINPARAVTAQNDTAHIARTPARVRSVVEEGDRLGVSSPAHPQNQRDTLAGREGITGNEDKELGRVSSPRVGHFGELPFDVRKNNDGECGSNVVPLDYVLRAALDAGYAMSQREGGRPSESRLGGESASGAGVLRDMGVATVPKDGDANAGEHFGRKRLFPNQGEEEDEGKRRRTEQDEM